MAVLRIREGGILIISYFILSKRVARDKFAVRVACTKRRGKHIDGVRPPFILRLASGGDVGHEVIVFELLVRRHSCRGADHLDPTGRKARSGAPTYGTKPRAVGPHRGPHGLRC